MHDGWYAEIEGVGAKAKSEGLSDRFWGSDGGIGDGKDSRHIPPRTVRVSVAYCEIEELAMGLG